MSRIDLIVAKYETAMGSLPAERLASDPNVSRTVAAIAKIKAASPEWLYAHDRDDAKALFAAAEAL